MPATLVFPPRTGPTYMPLGLACLAAAAAARNQPLDLFDANLELWNHLCDSDWRLTAMRKLSRGPLVKFLDPERYEEHWHGGMPIARKAIDRLEKQTRAYLAGDGLDDELHAMLARHAERIGRTTPDTVAFSTMYLDQLPFVLAQAKYLVHECHAGCRIVIGGASMSALSPEALLDAAPFVDAVLTGEGEYSFCELLENRPFERISGCYHRSGGQVVFSGPVEVPADLVLLPQADFSQLANGGYFNPVPVMPIYGGRGCKWRRCRFCAHNNSFGRFRERPGIAIAHEMLENHERYGCRHFYVVDQYVDPVSLNDLCDAILALGVDCRFEVMARTIGEYTPALLEKASRAGCCWISWGMESGSQRMLDLMNKGTQTATSQRVIEDAAAVGISNLVMMIFGAPGSDAASLAETCAFLERIWSSIDGMTASAFVLFDQTAFGRNPGRYGMEVLGGNRILELEGKSISDMKLRFRRDGEPGRVESPLAVQEIEVWERHKAWLPELPFYGRLCCEHYLLYADAARANSRPRNHRFCA